MIKIAVLGANPAWQKTLHFDDFKCGKVNRAADIEEFPSGKGVNFCRAVLICGISTPVLLQFAGGNNGRKLVNALDKLNIEHATSFTATDTRCCTTILNKFDSSTTECIEPSYSVNDEEINQLISMAKEVIPQCQAVAFCGTLPGSTDKKVYELISEIAAKNAVPLLLDVCKGIENVLRSDAQTHLKINRDELFLLTQQSDVKVAIKQLFNSYPSLQTAAITDGPERAYASDGKLFVSYDLPKLDNIVSTLGCGDTASAVYCSHIASGIPFDIAFKKALASASANCLSTLCGEFKITEAEKIEKKILCKSVYLF